MADGRIVGQHLTGVREPAMTLAESLRIALGAIAANKLRSSLTILGMMIGVAAVIVLVAVGNGSQRPVQAADRRARLPTS